MLDYIEYLNMPTKTAFALVGLFLFFQIIGKTLEFKGKVVPEIMNIKKYFNRKKQEREIIRQVPDALKEVQKSLEEFKLYYNADNIHKRDDWMKHVDETLKQHEDWKNNHEDWAKQICIKLDKNNEDTLDLLIDNKRNTIINFASYVIDENAPVTREQFNRIFKMHEDYENIIKKNKLTNGEVDIAFRVITEAYEKHMKTHSFIEDIRGYDNTNL